MSLIDDKFKSGSIIVASEGTILTPMSNSVLQPWVDQIPIRMQSTLQLSLRGTDTHRTPEIKKITRWMRGLTYKPGNPENVAEFMGEEPPRIVEKGPAAQELEFCTVHFYSHLMHGLEVIGYRHPNDNAMYNAQLLYFDMCSLVHLVPEHIEDFEERLKQVEWPGGVQPNDYNEAMKIIGMDK